jgi:hypothetical protein
VVAKARRAARRSWLRQPYLLLRVALDGHDHFNHFSILQIGEENLAVRTNRDANAVSVPFDAA